MMAEELNHRYSKSSCSQLNGSDSTSPIPGFGLLVSLSALLMAGFVSRRKHEI